MHRKRYSVNVFRDFKTADQEVRPSDVAGLGAISKNSSARN